MPWTASDDLFVQAQIGALRADIQQAGGLEAWLRDRLEAWLEDVPSCRLRIRGHRDRV